MKRAALILVLLATPAQAQVEMPATVKTGVCKLTPITIKNVPPKVSWMFLSPSGAEPEVFREHDPDQKTIKLRFHAEMPGTYYLVVASANGDVKQQVCVVTVTGAPPIPDPDKPPPSKLVKHLTFVQPTQATAGVANDPALRQYLAEIGVKVHLVTISISAKMKAAVDAAGGPPAIVLQDLEGNVLAIERMSTSDAAKKLVQRYLGQ